MSFARQAYNNAREVFPSSSIVTGMFSFQIAQLLDIAKPEASQVGLG